MAPHEQAALSVGGGRAATEKAATIAKCMSRWPPPVRFEGPWCVK